MPDKIRTHLFTAYLVLGTIVVALLGTPFLLLGARGAGGAVKIWARLMLFGLKSICGLGFRVEGAENIPEGPAIIAANHQSMWETIALYALAPHPAMVFKAELLRVPIYGWWGRLAGSIPVERNAGARAIRELARASKASLAEGRQIVVFPEGTRIRPGERRALQPGVAAVYTGSDAPCIPAVHDSGRYWLAPGGATSLKRPGEIVVRFLPAIAPGLARKPFMAELTQRLEAARTDLQEEPGRAPAPPQEQGRP